MSARKYFLEPERARRLLRGSKYLSWEGELVFEPHLKSKRINYYTIVTTAVHIRQYIIFLDTFLVKKPNAIKLLKSGNRKVSFNTKKDNIMRIEKNNSIKTTGTGQQRTDRKECDRQYTPELGNRDRVVFHRNNARPDT